MAADERNIYLVRYANASKSYRYLDEITVDEVNDFVACLNLDPNTENVGVCNTEEDAQYVEVYFDNKACISKVEDGYNLEIEGVILTPENLSYAVDHGFDLIEGYPCNKLQLELNVLKKSLG